MKKSWVVVVTTLISAVCLEGVLYYLLNRNLPLSLFISTLAIMFLGMGAKVGYQEDKRRWIMRIVGATLTRLALLLCLLFLLFQYVTTGKIL